MEDESILAKEFIEALENFTNTVEYEMSSAKENAKVETELYFNNIKIDVSIIKKFSDISKQVARDLGFKVDGDKITMSFKAKTPSQLLNSINSAYNTFKELVLRLSKVQKE